MPSSSIVAAIDKESGFAINPVLPRASVALLYSCVKRNTSIRYTLDRRPPKSPFNLIDGLVDSDKLA